LVAEETAPRDPPAGGGEGAECSANPRMALPEERIAGKDRPVVAGELERDWDEARGEDRRGPVLVAPHGEREQDGEAQHAGAEEPRWSSRQRAAPEAGGLRRRPDAASLRRDPSGPDRCGRGRAGRRGTSARSKAPGPAPTRAGDA